MSEILSPEERRYLALQADVLQTMRRDAADLAARWESQARSVALMHEVPARDSDDGDVGRKLVGALTAAFAPEDESEVAMTHGLRFGADAYAHGTSLHHTMKALDLLTAMTLYSIETALASPSPGASTGTAAEGVRLARRLESRAALLSLAATRGYMQAYADALRERFRHLRHDLRNPLGTIKSVLSLMDDDSIPLDARADPRFQAMARRNARSLEDLIADRLSDAAALLPVVAGQDVSLRSIACGVRRELRGDAERRGVNIIVGAEGPRGRLDAPGLELLLRGTLQEVLQECDSGEQLHVDFDDSDDAVEQARVMVWCASGRHPVTDAEAIGRLESLADQIGASLQAGARVVVSVPMGDRPTDGEHLAAAEMMQERVPAREASPLADREARDDVRGARQRQHGETSAL